MLHKVLNSKCLMWCSTFAITLPLLYFMFSNDENVNSFWRLLFWSGLILAILSGIYRRLFENTEGKVLSSIEANLGVIVVNTLITLSLVLVLIFLMPNVRETPNPDYDAELGPVLIENCAYDYAQGEICGEEDLNPEFLRRGENIILGAIALTGVAYYFLYTRAHRRFSVKRVEQINGIELSRNAKLSGIDLGNQNLTKAWLGGADLSGANLSNTRLLLAWLSDANLEGANLSGANLRGADLIGANLKDANLTGAQLREAKLFRAVMPDGTTHS